MTKNKIKKELTWNLSDSPSNQHSNKQQGLPTYQEDFFVQYDDNFALKGFMDEEDLFNMSEWYSFLFVEIKVLRKLSRKVGVRLNLCKSFRLRRKWN